MPPPPRLLAALLAAAAAASAAPVSLLLCAPALGASAPLVGYSNASATARVVVMVGASLNALWDKSCGIHGCVRVRICPHPPPPC
jgi:hypothetical protein